MELWIKALHVMAVIAWMAGLLYLPRLFVYHADSPVGSPQSETFKVMERRLMHAIMTPAMIVVWLTGPYLAWSQGMLGDGWLHAKFALVILMSGYHGVSSRWRKDLATDSRTRSSRFFRMVNEIPAVLMAGIVILVIVKPF